MKKLSGVFICLLLFTVLSSARIIEVADAGITDKLKAVIAAKNAGGASLTCTAGTGDAWTTVGYSEDQYSMCTDGSCGQDVANAEAKTICQIDVKVGAYTGDGTLHLEIWQSSAQVGSDSNVHTFVLDDPIQMVEFTFATPPEIAAADFEIQLWASSENRVRMTYGGAGDDDFFGGAAYSLSLYTSSDMFGTIYWMQ